MTSDPSHRPVSALRARMIEDMRVRGFTEKTRNDYVRNVRAFAAFIGRSPDTATVEDLRRFQLHQRQSGVQPPSINNSVSALRFFFTATLDRPDLARRLTVVREPLRLPAVLSVEEVTLLLQSAPGAKDKAALGTAYGAGLRVSEVVALKVGDIDSERMLLRVEQGKGRKDRHAMLSPQLLELLRDWWVEGRRRGVLLPRGWLFPGRNPIEPLSTRQINRAVHAAAEAAGLRAYAGHVSLGQLKVMSAIEHCRSTALGGHVERCQDCGHSRIAYNSCRNRHCPKCQGAAAKGWLAAREADLLPVDYFHVIFTLPAEIAPIAYQNKAVVYDLLFRTAAETLLTIAADPRHLGARIGATAVLHSWGSAMTHHPHVHMIVPGGGISLDNTHWVSCRSGFLLPVRVLSRLFRRLFLT